MQTAPLFVSVKDSDRVLITVGGLGIPQSVSSADLIMMCFRRVEASKVQQQPQTG